MICFRDTTFCTAKCLNHSCERRLTKQVEEAAVKWWGSDKAPIAVSDMSANCDQYQPEAKPWLTHC